MNSNTSTPVDDSYKLPFKFTRTIDKLTYQIGKKQLTVQERDDMAKKMATAHD